MSKFGGSKLAFLSVLIIILVGLGGIYFYLSSAEKTSNTTDSALTEKDINKMLDDLKKIINVPQLESPEIAIITDVDKLKGEPFFNNAKNGDRLLIFKQSGKVILYRPDENKIIDIATFGPNPFSGELNQQESSASQKQGIKLVILNGAGVTGLASKTEQTLKDKDIISRYKIEVTDKTNTEKDNYAETLIVDLSGGKLGDAPTKIAELLSGRVVTQMPEGEKTPTADLVIIAGKNLSK